MDQEQPLSDEDESVDLYNASPPRPPRNPRPAANEAPPAVEETTQDVPAAGRLMVTGRELTAEDMINIRGVVDAGARRLVNRLTPAPLKFNFGLRTREAAEATRNFRRTLEGSSSTEEVDAIIANFLGDIHATLVRTGIIPAQGHDLSEYADYYDLCLQEIKLYMNSRPSLSTLVAK